MRKSLILLMVCLVSLLLAVQVSYAGRKDKITKGLYIIAPTAPDMAGSAAIVIDQLAAASGGAVTEDMVAKNGANEGDMVGDKAWTKGEISPTGGDNANELVVALGFGVGDVDRMSIYGIYILKCTKAQSDVTARVGSDDAVKVWLNGEVVWENAVDRGASDFLDTFKVNLKAGNNLLLVKVSEGGGGWSMFTGVNADFEVEGQQFTREEEPPPAGPKITGPWLWMVVPTSPECGAAAVNIDWLDKASGGAVTEAMITSKGAKEGDKVGDNAWTLGEISPTGGDNLSELMASLGFGSGLDNVVAYGFIWVFSDASQKTWMFVGSDDAIKVWLNGEVVWVNPVNRGASDYQEDFPVKLKAGPNALLTAVYECGGGWSGFYGFPEGVTVNVATPVSPAGKLISTWGDLKHR